ncbi:MAG: 50S ribosomal protein L18, partial [Candidatus Pacearchaeota archaeon]
LAAAYLTGILIGAMAKSKGINEAIVDIGMSRAVKKSRFFAAVKGAIDGGLKISCSNDAMPEMQTIKNEKVRDFFDKVRSAL